MLPTHPSRPVLPDTSAEPAARGLVAGVNLLSTKSWVAVALGSICIALVLGGVSINHYHQRARAGAALADLRIASTQIARAAMFAALGRSQELPLLREYAQRIQAAFERLTPSGLAGAWETALAAIPADQLAEVTRRWAVTRGNIQTLLAAEPELTTLDAAIKLVADKDTQLLEAGERLLAQIEQAPLRSLDRGAAALAYAALQRLSKRATRMLAAQRTDPEALFAAGTDRRIFDESLARLEATLQGRDEITLRLRRQTQLTREHFDAYWRAVNAATDGLRRLASIQATSRSIQQDAEAAAAFLSDLQTTRLAHANTGTWLAVAAAAFGVLAALASLALARVRRAPPAVIAPLTNCADGRTRAAVDDMVAALGPHSTSPPPAIADTPQATIRAVTTWASDSMTTLRARQESLMACLSALTTTLQQSRSDAIAILEAYQQKTPQADAVSEDARRSVDRIAAVLSAARESVQSFETIASTVAKGASSSQAAARRAGAIRERMRGGEQRLRDLHEDLLITTGAIKQSLTAVEQLDVLAVNAAIKASSTMGVAPADFLDDVQHLTRRILEHLRRSAELVERGLPAARDAFESAHPSIVDAEAAVAGGEEARGHFERIDKIAQDLMQSIETICAQSKEIAARTVAVWEGIEGIGALDAKTGEGALNIVDASGKAVEQVLRLLPEVAKPAPIRQDASTREP